MHATRTDPVRLIAMLACPLVVVALAGCGGSTAAPPSVDPPSDGCPFEAIALADGGCQPVGLPPELPCPPGGRALADSACQPAGVPPQACGSGFEANGHGGCEPVLPKDACPPGQIAIPGQTTCAEIAPCGSGAYGDIPVDADTQFVDQTYSGDDGDGTRARPWTTLQQGVDAAAPGAILAVAAGRYTETVLVQNKQVRIWGRCPAMVEVVGVQGPAILLSYERAGASEVHGLRVSGPAGGILVADAEGVAIDQVWAREANDFGIAVQSQFKPGSVTLTRSLIEQSHGFGVIALAAEVAIEATVVRDGRLDDAGHYGVGVFVSSLPDARRRAALTLPKSLIERNESYGVANAGADAAIEATVIRENRAGPGGLAGGGIAVDMAPDTAEHGELSLRASMVERNVGVGVYVTASNATIETTVVRDTTESVAERPFVGINVEDTERAKGGKVVLRDSVVEGNAGAGVRLMGSEGSIEGTLIQDTQPVDGYAGYGIVALPAAFWRGEPSRLAVTGSRVERNAGLGVFAMGSDATIESTVVSDTRVNEDGECAGVAMSNSTAPPQRGSLAVWASLIERNAGLGVFVSGSDATVEATVVRDTTACAGSNAGVGVTEDRGTREHANLLLRTSLIERNVQCGVLLFGADVTIEGTLVRDTRPTDAGQYGWGISTQANVDTGTRGKLVLNGSLVERNQEIGVVVAQSDATIEATVVRETASNAEGEYGDGILVGGDALSGHALVSATESVSNARAGVLFTDASGDVTNVRASGNRFGLVLQGTPMPNLGDGNTIEQNVERDLVQGGNLPVPDTVAPVP